MKSGTTRIIGWLATCLLSGAFAAEGPVENQREADEQKEACRANLYIIRDAIQNYRRQNKDLPASLSDLVPRFLADPRILFCPLARKLGATSGDTSGFKIGDAKTSYQYEFALKAIRLSSGRETTMREWKRRQMALVGSVVPIVRCHLHHGRTLNLPFAGEVYESGTDWERNFTDLVRLQDLLDQDQLFRGAVEVLPIAPRPAECTLAQIDLSDFYNGSLTKEWYAEPGKANPMAAIRMGLQELAGVNFDVRGAVQLAARSSFRMFPDAASGIKVNQKCRRLYFLHSTRGTEKTATVVSRFVIHFADGDADELQVLYGTQVLDWWAPPGRLSALVAWTGSSEGRQSVRLYKTPWENPKPGTVVTSIDFISSASTSAPFLIAISSEP